MDNATNAYKLIDYSIQDGNIHPVAIICPGGGYGSIVDHVEGAPFAKKLNAMGISAFVVYYRVGENAAFPNPQDDLAKAVKEVWDMREEKHLDMGRYSIWGSSAGGHLVASFGAEKTGFAKYDLPKPAALVLIYPVISMGPLTHAGSRKNLIGDEPSADTVELLSIEMQVTSDYPPTFVWCGDADTCVNPKNSYMMAAALEKAGVLHKYMIFPGVGHGVGLGIGGVSEAWFEEAVSFWLSLEV